MAKSKIYIKPSKRGSFTSWCKSHGYGGVNSKCIAAGKNAGGAIAKKATFAANARKWRHADGGMITDDNIEEFLSGGALWGSIGNTAVSMASGAAVGGPLGAVIGLGSGILGMFKANKQQKAQEAQEAQQAEQEKLMQQQMQDEYFAGVGSSYNPTGSVFALGGPMGLNMSPAEVEGGEVLQTPGGKTQKIHGPKHEQGGIYVERPNGTKVFSDRLKVTSGKTYAEEAAKIKKQIEEYEKLLA